MGLKIFFVLLMISAVLSQDWRFLNCGGGCPNNCLDRDDRRSSCRAACDQFNYIGARCRDRNWCFCDNVCPLTGEARKPGDRSPRCPELNSRGR